MQDPRFLCREIAVDAPLNRKFSCCKRGPDNLEALKKITLFFMVAFRHDRAIRVLVKFDKVDETLAHIVNLQSSSYTVHFHISRSRRIKSIPEFDRQSISERGDTFHRF